jgi:hypothetical protein
MVSWLFVIFLLLLLCSIFIFLLTHVSLLLLLLLLLTALKFQAFWNPTTLGQSQSAMVVWGWSQEFVNVATRILWDL